MKSESAADGNVVSLVSGIIKDIGDLFAVELRIAKAEVEAELVKMAVAAGFIGVGVLLLLEMVVQWAHIYTELPMWACYGVVGLCSAGSGGLVLLRTRDSLRSI